MTDTFTKDGADELRENIMAYWAIRGQFPSVWVEPIEVPERPSRPNRLQELWVVRSDMLRGKPRKQFTEVAA